MFLSFVDSERMRLKKIIYHHIQKSYQNLLCLNIQSFYFLTNLCAYIYNSFRF